MVTLQDRLGLFCFQQPPELTYGSQCMACLYANNPVESNRGINVVKRQGCPDLGQGNGRIVSSCHYNFVVLKTPFQAECKRRGSYNEQEHI